MQDCLNVWTQVLKKKSRKKVATVQDISASQITKA